MEGQGFMRATNQLEQKEPEKEDELKILKKACLKCKRL